MSQNITTYSYGHIYKVKRNITNKDLLLLCNLLNNEFNTFYKSTLYKFEPECISEGGIIWAEYPNKIGYKSIRLFLNSYPWITKIYDDPEIIIHNIDNKNCSYEGKKIQTFLKSFDNAPKWTVEELAIFNKCFTNIDLLEIGKIKQKQLDFIQ